MAVPGERASITSITVHNSDYTAWGRSVFAVWTAGLLESEGNEEMMRRGGGRQITISMRKR